ncbi:MAG: single-stranded DNA-binding protein [Bacteroidota bacterium]
MNQVILIGRLTKEVELRYAGEKPVANFSIAVDRPFSKEKVTDFFNIVVWGKPAENCANYLAKGKLVGISGRIQNETYEKDGVKKYKTDIIAESVEFLSPKEDKAEKSTDIPEGFAQVEDDDVPF